jgi:hypothetical protein
MFVQPVNLTKHQKIVRNNVDCFPKIQSCYELTESSSGAAGEMELWNFFNHGAFKNLNKQLRGQPWHITTEPV